MRVNGPYIHTTGRLKGRRYLNIYFDDGKKTSILYSRWLMQQHLGRELHYNETVDHIDGNPTNDDLSNLQILSRSANSSKYFVDSNISITYINLVCVQCEKEFQRDLRHEKHNRKQGKKGPFCGKSCSGKWSRQKQLASMGKLANPADLGSAASA